MLISGGLRRVLGRDLSRQIEMNCSVRASWSSLHSLRGAVKMLNATQAKAKLICCATEVAKEAMPETPAGSVGKYDSFSGLSYKWLSKTVWQSAVSLQQRMKYPNMVSAVLLRREIASG
ncbi:hypothetical protein SRHO_G00134970 [Serrasalmus rhombeus]